MNSAVNWKKRLGSSAFSPRQHNTHRSDHTLFSAIEFDSSDLSSLYDLYPFSLQFRGKYFVDSAFMPFDKHVNRRD